MMSNEFEEALDNFLEGDEAEEAHQALYDIIRAAFLAGWRSAGGDPPQEQKLFELIPGGKPLEPPKGIMKLQKGRFPGKESRPSFLRPFPGTRPGKDFYER